MKSHDGRPYCESKEDEASLYASLPVEKKRQAVEFLRKELAPAAAEIRAAIKADPENWVLPYHFGWGMATRNALRKAGFGEEFFLIANLDDIYVRLVEEAMGDGAPPAA